MLDPDTVKKRVTERYMPADDAFDNEPNEDDEDDEEEGELNGNELDELLKLFDQEFDESNHDANGAQIESMPDTHDLSTIRQKGTHAGGYEHIVTLNPNNDANDSVVERAIDAYSEDIDEDRNNSQNDASANNIDQQPPSKTDLVAILLSKTTRRQRKFPGILKENRTAQVKEANGSVSSIIDWAKAVNLDNRQRRAFEIIAGTFVLSFYRDAEDDAGQRGQRFNFVKEKRQLEKLVEKQKRNSDQLICLLHGPGGSGKTTVIDLVMEYAREYCSYMDNYTFTSRTIVVTAMTGVAATLLMGETVHSAVHLNQKKPIQPEQVAVWEDTKLLIIDGISFADKKDFAKLHRQLRKLKQQLHKPYGGLNIIFAGDLRQLEPVGKGKKAVYKENCPEFKDWVNCFVELGGLHRFKDDESWGRLLLRIRDGNMTLEDIKEINKCVVSCDTQLPSDIRYATYHNRDRDAINAALFEEHCKMMHEMHGNTNDAIMVFSDNLKVRNSSHKYVPFSNCKKFWESCGEDNVKLPKGEGRMDPVLRFHKNSRLMLPTNSNVREGRANGSQATFEKLIVKPDAIVHTVLLSNRVPVKAVHASNVDHIVLRHTNKRVEPQVFTLEPKQYTFKAKILKPDALQTKGDEREDIRMKAMQLPVIINNATTGHKLQGSGVDNIFVHTWSYATNWAYVMLSRVKTKRGLFMRKPLSKDLRHYAVPAALVQMLNRFRRSSPTYWSNEQYAELFGEE